MVHGAMRYRAGFEPLRYAEPAREMSETLPTSPASGRALYVYYRVPMGSQAEAQALVCAMQARLTAAHPGLRANLLARADEAQASEPTWMEVYEHPDGISQECEAQLADMVATLPVGLIGPRHTEVFCELPRAAT
jgi:Domain of unknown function (DUF4936)